MLGPIVATPIGTASIITITGTIWRNASSLWMRSSGSSRGKGSIDSSKEEHLLATCLQDPDRYHQWSLVRPQHNLLGGRLRRIDLPEAL